MEQLSRSLEASQGKFLFLIVAYLGLTLLSGLPYFNIILTDRTILIVIFFLILLIFRIQEKFFISVAIALILLALVASLLRQPDIAEIFGNVTYALLVLIFAINFYGYLKKRE